MDAPQTAMRSLYTHYKGGQYYALMTTHTHHHNDDRDVVYVSLTYGETYTRPLTRDSRNDDSWTDQVTWPDGVVRQRFCRADRISPSEMLVLQTHWDKTAEERT